MTPPSKTKSVKGLRVPRGCKSWLENWMLEITDYVAAQPSPWEGGQEAIVKAFNNAVVELHALRQSSRKRGAVKSRGKRRGGKV